ALAALVLSGLPTARFVFEGFLPRTAAQRRRRLRALAAEERTIVLFESPHRLHESLADMVDALGDRHAAMARELTKMHEEVVRGPLSELHARAAEGVRGEVTLVIEGAKTGDDEPPDKEDVATRLRALIADGLTKKEAIAHAAADLDIPKKDVYAVAVEEGL
ncbi:MAG: SAM-dependent methyltransferase, partial [Actinomycetota bacterium]